MDKKDKIENDIIADFVMYHHLKKEARLKAKKVATEMEKISGYKLDEMKIKSCPDCGDKTTLVYVQNDSKMVCCECFDRNYKSEFLKEIE